MNNLKLFGYDLTPERLRIAAGLLLALLFVYNLYGGTWPSVEAYMAKRGEVEQLQDQIDKAKQVIYSREQVEAKLRDVKVALGQIQNRFPQRNQILSILLVDLSEIFRDSGTYLSSFEPQGFKPLEQGNLKNLGRMQIRIQARGDYPSIIMLFDKLSRYERVLRIEGPQVTPAGGSGEVVADAGDPAAAQPAALMPQAGFNRQLDVGFTLTTYALNR